MAVTMNYRRKEMDSFSVPRMPARGGASRIRRYDGQTQVDSDWDGLRKDKEIWALDGDCLVHLYARGSSKRGPSFKIRLSSLQDRHCSYLLEHCLHSSDSRVPSPIEEDGIEEASCSTPQSIDEPTTHVLYVPTPEHLNRTQAFAYHVTTRNYMAFISGQVLVGETLSSALVDLWDRIREWQPRSPDSARLVKYCEDRGYSNFSGNSAYALALLRFAESARFKNLWVDAFAHCVGMHDKLDLSSEYDRLSNTTKALITRASLEMDLHIARVTRALGGFLEEELGPEYLGLSKPARDHLDRFRSVLHSFYVEKLGYFPPNLRASWHKQLWQHMHEDFRCLYEYLVDHKSHDEGSSNKTMFGGVCVLQNINAFDERHGYTSLPHCLPLVPEVPSAKRSLDGQKNLLSFKLGRSNSTDAQSGPRQALALATNSQNFRAAQNELVQEYHRFERQRLEERITIQEARKVRWLLVYTTLQMLSSITRPPPEVRDSESSSYPLCVLTTGCPPWQDGEADKNLLQIPAEPVGRRSADIQLVPNTQDVEDRVSIHPDCEADNAEDYFTMSRKSSAVDLTLAPPPLRISTSLSKTATLRSSVHSSVGALHRSVVGSLSRRNGRSRTSTEPSSRDSDSPQPPATPVRANSGYCEIVIAGYGNGMDAEEDNARRELLEAIERTPPNEARKSLRTFALDLDEAAVEPIMEEGKLDVMVKVGENVVITSLQRNDSDASHSGASTDTAPFSPGFDREHDDQADTDGTSLGDHDDDPEDECECEMTDEELDAACEDEDDLSEDDDDDLYLESFSNDLPEDVLGFSVPRPASYRPASIIFEEPESGMLRPAWLSLNAGCYIPSGGLAMPPTRVPSGIKKTARPGSSGHTRNYSYTSTTSSDPAEEQESERAADDTTEVDARGRQRARALDQLKNSSGFNFLDE